MESYVKTSSGYALRKQSFGIVFRNHRILSFETSGSISSSILNAGGVVNIRIPRKGFEIAKRLWLQIDSTVATAAVRPLPSPLRIQQIRYFVDNGSDEGQKQYGENLYFAINTLPREQFESIAEALHMRKDNYASAGDLQVGSYRHYIPLIGSYLEDLYGKAFENDVMIEVTFRASLESGTAANWTVGSGGIKLLIEDYQPQSKEELSNLNAAYSGVVIKDFISFDKWFDSKTFTAGTLSNNKLDNIEGPIAYLQFGLRSSTSASSGSVYNFAKLGDKVSSGTFQLKDAAGQTISGSAIDAEFNRIDTSKHYDGEMFEKLNVYHIIHGSPQAALHGILAAGVYMYTGKEQLEITGGSKTAETARVVTFTPDATANGGKYQFMYTRGDGKQYLSAPLNYNASTSSIDSAIAAMRIPDISVASGGTIFSAGTGGLTLTITNLKEEDLAVNSAEWSIIAQLTDAGGTTNVTVTDTTAGVTLKGLNTGTYQIDVWAAKYRRIRVVRGKIMPPRDSI